MRQINVYAVEREPMLKRFSNIRGNADQSSSSEHIPLKV